MQIFSTIRLKNRKNYLLIDTSDSDSDSIIRKIDF